MVNGNIIERQLMTTEIEQWQTIQGMLRGYREAQILITCAQFGLFRQLAAGPQTAAELAAASNTHPAALRRLLDGAVAVNLLTKQGNSYANAPLAVACLAEEGPYHLGHLVKREGAFYQRWSYLPEAVRSGKRPEANIRDEDEENWVLNFELALLDLARTLGPIMAETLALPPDRPLKVLDVGGGHGGYSMALARHYPNVAATVFELPAAAAVATQLIAQAGLSDRVAVQTGDFQQEGLGQEIYDLILIFGVLLSETPEGKLDLLRKVRAALVPGGQVVIREFFLDPDAPASSTAAIFSLQMLLSTGAGDLTTLAQLESWLQETGFEQPHQLELPDWVTSNLLLARKPG
jgi:2-polyprenyl-3-methyl-5-hydroxy-6-metoxy-1,4-benzoquinol methylase